MSEREQEQSGVAATGRDTVSATLRAMAESARDISVTLHIAADIRDGERGEESDKAVVLLVRRAERLACDLRRQLRRFPVG